MPKSVAGVAVEGGRFFIARRGAGGDLGGKWEFPGGKVEEGESDEEALFREYREEFDCAIRVGLRLGSVSFEHRGLIRTLNAYTVTLPPDFTLREHVEWRWALPDEIERLDFAESDRRLLPCLKDSLAHQ
jgi:8-oxo-dGTP diphosphatase